MPEHIIISTSSQNQENMDISHDAQTMAESALPSDPILEELG